MKLVKSVKKPKIKLLIIMRTYIAYFLFFPFLLFKLYTYISFFSCFYIPITLIIHQMPVIKRSLTDITDDGHHEMNLPVSNNPHNDLFQFISIPNVSQESLQKTESVDMDMNPSHSFNSNNLNNLSSMINNNNNNNNNSSNNITNHASIYNSYANPNSFANPHLTNYLYDDNSYNNIYTNNNDDNMDNGFNNQCLNTSEFTMNQQNNQIFPSDFQFSNNSNTTTNNNNNINEGIPDDDILMVPQDNFYIYDHQDPQFVPEMMQLELSNKSFPQSNELNIFKGNDVLYEFSDDDDEDDDLDLQNKLDDDDEEEDEDDDDDDFEDDDLYNLNQDNSPSGASIFSANNNNITPTNDNYVNNSNINNNNFNTINMRPDTMMSNNDSFNENSIYSLTVPNQLNSNSTDVYHNFPSPLSNYNNMNETSLYSSDENDIPSISMNAFSNAIIAQGDEDDDEEDDDDDDGEDDDEDDENDDNDFAIDNDSDSELNTPSSNDRRSSVTADTTPIIKKERSSSLRPTTRPKRLRRKSHISNTLHNTTPLRKPRNSTSNSVNNDFSINDLDDQAEEHVCNIPNPKTGKPCLKKFSRPYDLVRHQNTIHASKRSFYRCMFCEDDLRRKHGLESVNEIVVSCKYRNSNFSTENSHSHSSSSHNIKKVKSGALDNSGYLSNKTFSRCDALTRHLRFRHGLNNTQVNDAMNFAKKNIEFYDN